MDTGCRGDMRKSNLTIVTDESLAARKHAGIRRINRALGESLND